MRQAASIDPKDTRCRYYLALLLLCEGDLQRAIAAFREAVAIDPLQENLLYGLAEALHRSGDRDGEIRALREAIRVQSTARKQRPEPSETNGPSTTQLASGGASPEAVTPDPHSEYDEAASEGRIIDGFLEGVMQASLEVLVESIATERGYLALGNALAESGDLSGAISAYDESIRHGEPHTEQFPPPPVPIPFALSSLLPTPTLATLDV